MKCGFLQTEKSGKPPIAWEWKVKIKDTQIPSAPETLNWPFHQQYQPAPATNINSQSTI